jgi:hypothetical protein
MVPRTTPSPITNARIFFTCMISVRFWLRLQNRFTARNYLVAAVSVLSAFFFLAFLAFFVVSVVSCANENETVPRAIPRPSAKTRSLCVVSLWNLKCRLLNHIHGYMNHSLNCG